MSRISSGGRTPLVMGILNLTPDSFSDGGRWTDKDKALAHAFEMIDQGADIIDIGGESTRPGSEPVTSSEELERLEPVLKELIPSVSVPISIDTMKPEVASVCISMGADIINDVNGLRAQGMMEVCAGSDVRVVIGHMNGSLADTHSRTMGDDYRAEISGFMEHQISRARDLGISDDRIIVDPGVGFGKTPQQNMDIASDCSFLGRGHDILIGVSRKRFIRQFYPDKDVDEASAVVARMAVDSGADIVRVHDVARTVSVLRP